MSSAQGLVSPTTLVVDFSSQKLYWLDSAAMKVGRVNFDGSGLQSWTQPSFSVATSIIIYQVRYTKYQISNLFAIKIKRTI